MFFDKIEGKSKLGVKSLSPGGPAYGNSSQQHSGAH
jgi:hypothetical protein